MAKKVCYFLLFLMHLQNLICKIIIIHGNLENCLKQLDANNAPDKTNKQKAQLLHVPLESLSIISFETHGALNRKPVSPRDLTCINQVCRKVSVEQVSYLVCVKSAVCGSAELLREVGFNKRFPKLLLLLWVCVECACAYLCVLVSVCAHLHVCIRVFATAAN